MVRIKKIILKNFRQFRETEINFLKNNRDLQIIIGRNGTGKTNLMNAINWCLYDDEPHLSNSSHKLPIVNLKQLKDKAKSPHIISVELWLEEENSLYMINRKATCKYKGGEIVSSKSQIEIVQNIEKDDGNTDIRTYFDEDAEGLIDRFIPKNIREYYFFDGEKLNNYFEDQVREHIKHAVFVISQIDLLERVETKVDTLLRDLVKQAGKFDPKIDVWQQELESITQNTKNIQKEINESEKHIEKGRSIIKDCDNRLGKFENIQQLEKERKSLIRRKEEKQSKLKEKNKDKEEIILKFGKLIMFWDAIENTINIIDEKRKKNEIPPNLNDALLEEIIEKKYCIICKRNLEKKSLNHVENLLNDIKLSSEIGSQLLDIEIPLQSYYKTVPDFLKERKKVIDDIMYFKDEKDRIDKRLADIQTSLVGYNINNINELAEKRQQYVDFCDEQLKILGGAKERLKSALRKKEEIEAKIRDAVKKEEKFKKIRRGIMFFSKTLSIIKDTKKSVMEKIRKEIEEVTKTIFFDLIWKKETYKGLEINENYFINLIHFSGFRSLATASAAERQLLALAFMLAIHEVSGFSSSILIDTPVGRVSDENRENFGRIFLKISEKKQVILLFTPDEYSKNISNILSINGSNIFKTILSKDELSAVIGGNHNDKA